MKILKFLLNIRLRSNPKHHALKKEELITNVPVDTDMLQKEENQLAEENIHPVKEQTLPNKVFVSKVKKMNRKQRKVENSLKNETYSTTKKQSNKKTLAKKKLAQIPSSSQKSTQQLNAVIKSSNTNQFNISLAKMAEVKQKQVKRQMVDSQESSRQKEEETLFIDWINTNGVNIQKDEEDTSKMKSHSKQSSTKNVELEVFKKFLQRKYSKELRLNQITMDAVLLERYKPYVDLLSLGIKVKDLSIFSNFKDMGTFFLIEIDVHGYLLLEFKQLLQHLLLIKQKQEIELRCIHGYTQGTVIRDYLRIEFKHNRLKSINTVSQNDGRTDLILARQ